MSKKLTIEVSDEVHAQLVAIQEKKKAAVKAKVPLAGHHCRRGVGGNAGKAREGKIAGLSR